HAAGARLARAGNGDGGRGHARGEHGRARARPWRAITLPARTMDAGGDRDGDGGRCRGARVRGRGVDGRSGAASIHLAAPMAADRPRPARGDRAARGAGAHRAEGIVMAVLVFREVGFRYPDEMRDALRDVTLEVDAGTFALVVGPTGAGKSTLLRAVNGLVP